MHLIKMFWILLFSVALPIQSNGCFAHGDLRMGTGTMTFTNWTGHRVSLIADGISNLESPEYRNQIINNGVPFTFNLKFYDGGDKWQHSSWMRFIVKHS